MVAGSDGWSGPSASPVNNLLGRRNRWADTGTGQGAMSGRAYGNAGSADLMVESDVRGQRAAQPGKGTGSALTGSNSFFGLRLRRRQSEGPWYNPGGPGGAFGGGWADGLLTVRDRHIMTRTGSSGHGPYEANNGIPNPLHDFPYAGIPEYQMVNTSESWQLGTDHTTNEDNTSKHNTVPVRRMLAAPSRSPRGDIDQDKDWDGRTVFPLGTQDGSQTLVMGPPLDSWREYGSRGPRGMHGPAPDIWDPNWVPARGAGGGGGRGLMTQAGDPGTQSGDRRLAWGGYPHGLHSPTVQSTVMTGARFSNTPQMAAPRLDRPASSKISGQSYSQTIVPESQQGQVNAMPRNPDPGRVPGIRDRFVRRS